MSSLDLDALSLEALQAALVAAHDEADTDRLEALRAAWARRVPESGRPALAVMDGGRDAYLDATLQSIFEGPEGEFEARMAVLAKRGPLRPAS